jgi:hypothetical protein
MSTNLVMMTAVVDTENQTAIETDMLVAIDMVEIMKGSAKETDQVVTKENVSMIATVEAIETMKEDVSILLEEIDTQGEPSVADPEIVTVHLVDQEPTLTTILYLYIYVNVS